MDKYEYNLKLEEITKLADQGYYEDAADIIDTIDWRRVRNVRTLCMISEIYEEVGRLQDSKALLLRAYRKSQAVRSILFHLTEISVKLREFDDAAEFYSEFVEAAPHDNSRYLLKYMIYRGRGAAIEDQIEILEEYNQKEYTEKYAYELAKLYYRAGQKEKCVDACDDLVVWFRQGKYVIRALELKQRIKALTPVQQAIYDNRNEATMPKAEMVENVAPDLEKAILENMPESSKEVITDDVISVTEKEIAQSVAEHTAEKEEKLTSSVFPPDSNGPSENPDVPPSVPGGVPVTPPTGPDNSQNPPVPDGLSRTGQTVLSVVSSGASVVQYLSSLADLRERTGEIRRGSSDGAYVLGRYEKGRFDPYAGVHSKLRYTTVSLGTDKKIDPNWIVGAQVGFTDGDVRVKGGAGKTDIHSIGGKAYLTWFD